MQEESFKHQAHLYEKLKLENLILPSCILANVDKNCYTGLKTHTTLQLFLEFIGLGGILFIPT